MDHRDTKEQAAERAWAREQEVLDLRARKDAANQRNSVVAFIVGMVMLGGGLFLVGAGAAEESFGIIGWAMGLGLLLIVLGIYFRGKRYDR